MAQSGDGKNQAAGVRPVSIKADTMQGLSLAQPPPLSFEGDLAKNFKTWIRHVELYMVATECHKKSSEIKAAILLHLLGEEGVDKFDTIDLPEAKKKDYDEVLKALGDYCMPKTNESINRHTFFNRNQKEGENITEYVAQLKKLSVTCNFEGLRDSLIKDRIIGGLLDKTLQERLLREQELSLEKCINMCKTAEIATQYMRKLTEEDSKDIDKINRDHRQQPMSRAFKCKSCGYQHPPRRCPAYGKQCNYCKKMNHFSTVCRNRMKDHNIKEIQQNPQQETNQEYTLGTVYTDWTLQE
ncbi:uncharacterized protein LOC135081157 [Ostrinia nubilalis]|uniref:uncharacterized protein LOC135081157 n=1 Tax=Ostrinia nubilalis TaxID=29057 RepID=UPI003082637D